jgi:elongation factor G
LTDIRVKVSNITLATNTTSTASLANSLRGCAARGVATLLRQAREDRLVHMLEPVMSASVALASSSLGDVLSDLTSKRRAHIIDVGQLSSGQNARSYIHAEVPLASMLGYASALRSTTQGNGSFSMEFLQFRTMPTHLQTALIESPP